MSTPTSSSLQDTPGPNLAQHQSAKVKVVAGYALQQRLGSGSFATVYKGFKVSDDDGPAGGAEYVAIKAISRTSEKLTRKVLDNLELEISILRTYRHPNIVCLHEVQKTDRNFYLILEFCGGGDLQRLIRTRKTGRLSERLTRRLMRDLASGLHFLWGQELIHRDIKPQNLLLTGPLPMDEVNDPAKMDTHEEMRKKADFPSAKFALKIADFGFARHLETASLAETLCGSPLYMAPEILQHQRYDSKADLWSVGTVLFEMISGRPPFNGENHIDLLRNIQRKAVRLPPDVHVSKECVKLLRMLLNRNPLSRAGFKEFFHACEAFVALGCEGVKTDDVGVSQPTMKMDLGTIHEADAEETHAAASMMTTATTHHAPHESQPLRQSRINPTPTVSAPVPAPAPETVKIYSGSSTSAPVPIATPSMVTPPFGPMTNPSAPFSSPPTEQVFSSASRNTSKGYAPFAPLEPSPPQTPASIQYASNRVPSVPVLEEQPAGGLPGSTDTPRANIVISNTPRNDLSSNSSDDSGFVMVERGTFQQNDFTSPSSSGTVLVMSGADSYNMMRREGRTRIAPSPPASPLCYAPKASVLTTRGEYLMVNDSRNRQVPKGMLSTSPGTGGALVGMMGGSSRPRLLNQSSGDNLSPRSLESQIASATKTIAIAEDVGRRAISVAHLGDTRAYLAMRILTTSDDEGRLLLSAAPMEGVEEESGEHSSANVTDTEDSVAFSNQVASSSRRRSISTDRSMPDVAGDDENEEMPFAFAMSPDPESTPKELMMRAMPARSDASSMYRQSRLAEAKMSRAQPEVIRSHFGEALSCYLKALSMLKGVLNAVQKLRKDLGTNMGASPLSADQQNRLKSLLKRCDVTSNWLTGQFSGVLERADAANVEMGKLPMSQTLTGRNETVPVATVEELIYNHSLACGRDAAVKQLLGQYDAARTCYRSAGLLAETLLMEQSIGREDRRLLEGYVDGFAERIMELDRLMVQQSQTQAASGGCSQGNSIVASSRRGSGVIGIIGGIPQSNSGSDSSPPFLR